VPPTNRKNSTKGKIRIVAAVTKNLYENLKFWPSLFVPIYTFSDCQVNDNKVADFQFYFIILVVFVLAFAIIPYKSLLESFSDFYFLAIARAIAASMLFVIPALFALSKLKDIGIKSDYAKSKPKKGESYLKSKKFWIIAVNAFIVPFISTAVFLYQYIIGQDKGWDTSWIAFSFSFYAIFFAVFGNRTGKRTDRVVSTRYCCPRSILSTSGIPGPLKK